MAPDGGSPEEALDRLFRALADATRRRLLAQLALGPARVTDLARPFRMSLPAVSKHLRILEEAGLVSRRVDGRVHRISLRGSPLEQVEVWLDPFRSYWAQSLGDLKRELERGPGRAPSRGRPDDTHRT
jgi:DNA-binding transcriptional ArsR family regulator